MTRTNTIIVALVVSIGIAAGLIFWLSLDGGNVGGEGSAIPIRLGAVLPLTGPAAQIGDWQKKGLEVAIEHLNATGGIDRRPLTVSFEDSQSSPAPGVSAFQKVLLDVDVPVVFSSLSSVSSAILPIADERRVNLMMLAVSLPEITKRSSWAFRCNLGSDDEAEAMAKYLAGTPLNDIAVAYINDDFGVGAAEVFRREASNRGLRIVLQESYARDEADLRTLALKLRQTKADAVYVVGYVNASVQLIKQLKELGAEMPVLGNMALSVPSFLELGGEALHGARFTVSQYDPNSNRKEVRKFVESYKDDHREIPNFFAAFAYDAAFLVAEAMREEGTEAAAIRTGLLAIEEFPGVLGSVTVGPTGDIEYPTMIVENVSGEIVPRGEG